MERATIEQIRNRLLDEGTATAAEIDDHLANIGGGQLELATSPMITASGRRPPEI